MANVNFAAPQIDGRQHLAQRAADCMLRALGPSQVSLRIAEPSTGDLNNQLGITTPTVEDVPLSPAVVRNISSARGTNARFEILLSVNSLQQAVAMYNVDDVTTWLLTAVALVYGEKLLHVDSVIVEHYAGSEYLYRMLTTE